MPRKTPAEYLSDLRRIARERGGRLLSRRYLGDAVKLRYRCAEGHEWLQAPTHTKAGKWCPTCGARRGGAIRRARNYERLRAVVAKRSGRILSDTYVNSRTKMRFRCARGHEWDAAPNSIMQGTWCKRCASIDSPAHEVARQRVSRRLSGAARRRGGEMISPYRGSHALHRFRCAAGHVWSAKPESIDAGVWCPKCREQELLKRFRAKAAEQRGALLSRRCRNGKERLLWRCEVGHRWRAPGGLVVQGIWCPYCRLPSRDDIGRMRAAARAHGGRCLSRTYIDSGTRLRWRCAEGHEWEATPGSVIQGAWCRVCQRGWGKSRARLTIDVMREMARENGGECLSKTYGGIYGKLRWRCAMGHEWTTVANNVRRGGWCPVCAHSARGTLDGMRALAAERGGRCLTRKWDNHREPLSFRCARGHRFRARANVVKSGTWCPVCTE